MTRFILSVPRQSGKSANDDVKQLNEVIDDLKKSLKDEFAVVAAPANGSPRALVECSKEIKQAIKELYPELRVTDETAGAGINPPQQKLKN